MKEWHMKKFKMIATAGVFMTALLLASLFSTRASAEWPPLGRALSGDPANQERPEVTTDGSGGAIVVWHDLRSAKVNIFARRVFATGELDPLWPVDGQALLTDPAALATAVGGQDSPVIASDGAGGAIVAWRDQRSGSGIFVQHVLASGAVDVRWPANGLALTTVAGQQGLDPKIATDGTGGAIVAWTDVRLGVHISAQHVLSSGVVDPTWPAGGVVLVSAPGQQFSPDLVADGSGGAIVTWLDGRSGPADGANIYAQRVLSTGIVDPAWPVDGRAICTHVRDQLNPAIASDGAHGAIVTWEDLRDITNHIYAQRVLAAGAIAPGWPVDGLALSTPVAFPYQKDPRIISDGAGGAIVAWEDYRNTTIENPLNTDPFAQHVLASGVIDAAWPVDGKALSRALGEASSISIAVDGAAGAIVAWEEDGTIMTQHIRATGVLDPAFPSDGRLVRNLPSTQNSPDLVAASAGNAIVAWADSPNGTNFDIYAMIVSTQTATGVDAPSAPPAFTFAVPSPNPSRGSVALRFGLPSAAHVSLAIYDVAGHRVRQIANGEQSPGDHEIAWDRRDDSGRAVSAGFYFARLEIGGRALTQKFVTLK
jgi:hypothetical protein